MPGFRYTSTEEGGNLQSSPWCLASYWSLSSRSCFQSLPGDFINTTHRKEETEVYQHLDFCHYLYIAPQINHSPIIVLRVNAGIRPPCVLAQCITLGIICCALHCPFFFFSTENEHIISWIIWGFALLWYSPMDWFFSFWILMYISAKLICLLNSFWGFFSEKRVDFPLFLYA